MNILFVHGANCGVSYYRSWMPAKWMARLDGVEVLRFPNEKGRIYWTEEKLPEDATWLTNPSMERLGEWADVIHVGRLESLADITHFHAMMDWYRSKGMKKVLISDMDDDILNVARDNPVYTQFNVDTSNTIQLNDTPLQEGCPPVPIEMKDGSKRYINNVRADYKYFATKQLTVSDGVTVSTPYLRRLYGPYNQRVLVVKNAIDLEDFPLTPKCKDKTVRIGWAGGHAHYDDLNLIWDVVLAVCEKYPQARFVYCGTKFDFLEKMPAAQREEHPFVGIEDWPETFCKLKFDIGIAPLTGKSFNRGKSNLKWLENASQKTPTICSAVDPFLESVVDKKTGLIARSKEDWFKALAMLIENETERKRLGERAYSEVRRKWSAEIAAKHWRDAFERVLN